MSNLSTNSQAKRLSDFIGNIKDHCELTDSEISDLMGESYSGNPRKISILAMTRLMDRLNVSPDQVVQDEIDYQAVRLHFKENIIILPEKYRRGLNSSTRFTAAYMIDYIRRDLGKNAEFSLLRRLQLHPELMLDFTLKNNILLSRDICQHVAHFYGDMFVQRMGGHSLKVIADRLFAWRVHECKTIQEYLVKFFYEIIPGYVEKNFQWEFMRLTSDETIIRASPSPFLTASFRQKEICTAPLEKLRLGFIQGILDSYSKGQYIVRQVSSISSGDTADLYCITPLRRQCESPIIQ
jgi:hypothetical protein